MGKAAVVEVRRKLIQQLRQHAVSQQQRHDAVAGQALDVALGQPVRNLAADGRVLEIEDTRRIHGYTQLVYATGEYTTNQCTRPHLCTRHYIEK